MRFLKYFLPSLIIILVAIRLCLPTILIRYVETQVNTLPEYRVKIADLDLNLYRGSYTIKNLQLWKVNKNIPVPFFKADTIDLSIQWRALLQGKFVGKIVINHPQLNFVDDPHGKNAQLSIDEQWVAIVKSLFPLNINQLTIHQGQIHLRSFNGKPPFDIYLKDAEFELKNMQAHESTSLPSSFSFNAKTMGTGTLVANGQFNPFSKSPTFKMNLELKSMNIAELQSFLHHYTSINVKNGAFNLYFEAAAAQNKIVGYAKPFIKDLVIGGKTNNPIEALYNGAVAVIGKILENPDKKTIATRVKIQGKIDDPNVSTLSIIGYLLRHAFIQALIPQIDNTVKVQDVIYANRTHV